MIRSRFTLMLLLTAIAGGCQSEGERSESKPHDSTALMATPTWLLRKMTESGKAWDFALDGKTQQLVTNPRVKMSFTDAQLSGKTGCNHFVGSYRARPDGTFQCEGASVTEMPCPGKLEQQQEQLLRLLSLAKRWRLQNNVLTLSDGTAANELQLVPFNPSSLSLRGTKWRLTHFAKSEAPFDSAESVLPDHPIDLQLDAGQAGGWSGCNRFQCKFQLLEGDRLAWEAPTATKKQCRAEAMKQEEKFLRLLPQMTRYSIRETTLTLTDAEDRWGLQFEGQR
jgi:heat shock protein HslJ